MERACFSAKVTSTPLMSIAHRKKIVLTNFLNRGENVLIVI